jgi:hypothetical protein
MKVFFILALAWIADVYIEHTTNQRLIEELLERVEQLERRDPQCFAMPKATTARPKDIKRWLYKGDDQKKKTQGEVKTEAQTALHMRMSGLESRVSRLQQQARQLQKKSTYADSLLLSTELKIEKWILWLLSPVFAVAWFIISPLWRLTVFLLSPITKFVVYILYLVLGTVVSFVWNCARTAVMYTGVVCLTIIQKTFELMIRRWLALTILCLFLMLANYIFFHWEQLLKQARWRWYQFKGLKVCICCYDEHQTMVIVPCGHKCVCKPCAELLRKHNHTCPLCRKPISTIIPLFE